jgi:hypothetical protein
VAKRWKEYGFDRKAPQISVFEDDKFRPKVDG